MSARPRLDVWLVGQGLAESREKAQALVMAGRVRIEGVATPKPGTAVRPGSMIEVLDGPQHVGRGAVKLAGALDAFGIDPTGRVAVDVGASTGGFTETLLERGAARVYAVDVGRAQLHERLRNDPRVVVLDRLNARSISRRQLPEPCGLGTLDVSFISVLKILPALRDVLDAHADVVALVKPQFEVGKGQVGRGGIVRDAGQHRACLQHVGETARTRLGYAVVGACASPITGASGNREFFLHLKNDADGLGSESLAEAIDQAVTP